MKTKPLSSIKLFALVVFGGALLWTAGFVFSTSRDGSEHGASQRHSSMRVAHEEAKPERPHESERNLNPRLKHAPAEARSAPIATLKGNPNEAGSDAAAAERVKVGMRQFYEDIIAREARDPASATSAETAISSYLSSRGSAIRLKRVECRQTLCKLELSISPDAPRFWGDGPFIHGGHYQTTPDGTTLAYVGMTNEGFPHPDLASLSPERAP